MVAARLTGDVDLIPARTIKADKARLKAIAALYEESEEDAAKRAGLVGYLCYLARNHPRSYASLLARVLPLQIKMEAHETVIYRSTQEILQSIKEKRLPLKRLMPLLIGMSEAETVETTEESQGEISHYRGVSHEWGAVLDACHSNPVTQLGRVPRKRTTQAREASHKRIVLILHRQQLAPAAESLAPRAHSIPDLVEIAPQVGFELPDRLPVHPGPTRIGFDRFVRPVQAVASSGNGRATVVDAVSCSRSRNGAHPRCQRCWSHPFAPCGSTVRQVGRSDRGRRSPATCGRDHSARRINTRSNYEFRSSIACFKAKDGPPRSRTVVKPRNGVRSASELAARKI